MKPMKKWRLLKSKGYKKESLIAEGMEALHQREKKQENVAKLFVTMHKKTGKPMSDYKVRSFTPFSIQTARSYQYLMESPYADDREILEAIHQHVVDKYGLGFYPNNATAKRLREVYGSIGFLLD